jgi:predicted permease
MSVMRTLRRKLRALFSKDELDGELNDEVRLHIAMETEDLVRSGVDHVEAARRARIAFGGVERHKEEARDARGVQSVEDGVRDIAYILRSLRRAPVFTLAVVLSLALGIGANSTMFTIISAVLLRPLPYPHAEELVGIVSSNRAIMQENLPEPHYLAWARESRTLAGIALYTPTDATVAGNAPPERVLGSAASAGLFGLLQVRPAIGRDFNVDDCAVGAAPVVILSDALWRRHFGADSAVVGRVVDLNDKPVTVIGVMPRDAEFPQRAEYWVPWITKTDDASSIWWVGVVARLRHDVSSAQVQLELARIARETDHRLPKFLGGNEFIVMPLHDQLFGSARPALELLFAAVVLLLLIACANVANLVLARTTQRQREFAVRVTLGATRSTLMWLVLGESAILAAAGATFGFVISIWTTRLFVSLSPPNISRVPGIGVNAGVFVFTAVLAMCCALFVGLGPALRASRRDPRASLGDGGAREGSGRGATRFRRALVVAQLSIAVVLLAGAGLFIRSLERLTSVDLGFRPQRVLVVNISLPRARYAGGTRGRAFFDQLIGRIKSAPGVVDVTDGPEPLGGFNSSMALGPTSAHPGLLVAIGHVGARFFETFGIAIREGRGILASDDSTSPKVAVINVAAAHVFFPNGGAIGQPFEFTKVDDVRPTIVGVVADFPQRDVAVRAMPEVFLASAQNDNYPFTISVRTSGDPAEMTPVVRAAVHELDPALAVGTVTTMDKVVASSMAPIRFASLLLGSFAGLALVLAALGLYGVIAYGVTRRLRELGIRAALGATGPALVRLVAGEMVWVIGLGMTIGLAGAWLLARATRDLLYGTGVHDPLTFVLVPVALMIPAAIATLLPARRALEVNPLDVIQAE